MKLVIFGATGTVGRHIIDQALDQGHHVTAFTRSLNKFPKPLQNLTLRQGDVLDLAAVKHAIAGQDAVICALGMPLFNREGLRTKGTKVILQAMKETGVDRLICLSAMGSGESKPLLPAYYRYFMMPIIMRSLYADHNAQEQAIRDSDANWTLIRPVNFTKGPKTGSYWHGSSLAGVTLSMKIAAADVADFMVKQVSTDQYLHQAPCLSYQA